MSGEEIGVHVLPNCSESAAESGRWSDSVVSAALESSHEVFAAVDFANNTCVYSLSVQVSSRLHYETRGETTSIYNQFSSLNTIVSLSITLDNRAMSESAT